MDGDVVQPREASPQSHGDRRVVVVYRDVTPDLRHHLDQEYSGIHRLGPRLNVLGIAHVGADKGLELGA